MFFVLSLSLCPNTLKRDLLFIILYQRPFHKILSTFKPNIICHVLKYVGVLATRSIQLVLKLNCYSLFAEIVHVFRQGTIWEHLVFNPLQKTETRWSPNQNVIWSQQKLIKPCLSSIHIIHIPLTD